ncbi:polyprenyl synthetase family protein [Streptomyces sp. NPDC059009]|uniref:polyprenyl synthetase family protein n=1 Tax=Streptomyces sp. NPDC059009 TaxID=3346694 RepID=UPI0036AAAB85
MATALRRMVEYHFGWNEQGEPTGRRDRDEEGGGAEHTPLPGKALRPALALLCAEAVCTRRDRALPAAVAVELVHNFSLVHDDLIDGDAYRHGRPTLWSRFGRGEATLTGDALFALAFRVLAEAPAPRLALTLCELADATHEMADGQALDLLGQGRGRVDGGVVAERACAVARAKTGALMGCACAVGAIAGGADDVRTGHFRAFGRSLGLAFQLADDLLGIWGDPGRTGKPVGSDLAERRVTLPVAAALASRTAAGRELAERYDAVEPPGMAEVPDMTRLVEQAGGRLWAVQALARFRAEAAAHLRRAAPASGPGGMLSGLAAAAACRSH